MFQEKLIYSKFKKKKIKKKITFINNFIPFFFYKKEMEVIKFWFRIYCIQKKQNENEKDLLGKDK